MAKHEREMVHCHICEADAFIKSRLGSSVILDCNHVVNAGVLLAKRRGARNTGRTSREVWKEHMARMGKSVPPEPPHPVDAGEEPDEAPREAQKPRGPVATFDTGTAAKTIGNLLKRRDK